MHTSRTCVGEEEEEEEEEAEGGDLTAIVSLR